MARKPSLTATINPIVSAYFREADTRAEHSGASEQAGDQHLLPTAEESAVLAELIAEARLIEQQPVALLGAGNSEHEAVRLPHLTRVMSHLRSRNENLFITRGSELAFLANALLEGCSLQQRPFTPSEAAAAAADICNRGLENAAAPDSFLVDHDLVKAFELGWSTLHREVGLFAADQLIAVLADLDVESDLRLEFAAFRRTLIRHREADAPWRARDASEIIAMLDPTAWISMMGLLDECPVMAAALTAILVGGTKTVSPTDFAFISSMRQVEDVRRFVRRLPELLSR